MADEELVENEGKGTESPPGTDAEADRPPETALGTEAEAPGEPSAPENPVEEDSAGTPNPDQKAAGEKDIDDLVEQQMLEELERLEQEPGANQNADIPVQAALDETEMSPDSQQNVQRPEFPVFDQTVQASSTRNLDLLLDVNLPISIELGRATMKIKDILNLGPGSVVELKKLAGEPVDLLVNNKIIAKGEVVVVDENFGLRITTLLSPEERLRLLE